MHESSNWYRFWRLIWGHYLLKSGKNWSNSFFIFCLQVIIWHFKLATFVIFTTLLFFHWLFQIWFRSIATRKECWFNKSFFSSSPHSGQNLQKTERLIRKYSQFVIDPNGCDDYCPVCNKHLDEASGVHSNIEGQDMISVVCLTSCQHKVHMACLKWTTPEMSSCLKCPTCGNISGNLHQLPV